MNSVQGWWKYSKTEWLKKHWKAIKTACYLTLILRRKKALALFLTLKRFGWNWSIWDILKEKWLFEMLKFHGVLTSCRVKRAPHSAAFPNLGSEAYESVSECSQRPHMDERGQKVMLCKNVIGCDERCWIISMSKAFPKQLSIAAKERTWTAKKIDQKK